MVILLPIIEKGMVIGRINLKTRVVDHTQYSQIFFRCNSLTDCCRNLRIPVTEFDIQNIQKRGYELDQIIESLSPQLIPSKTPHGESEKVYLLKKNPFDGSCTFLENDCCSIHEFKPFACKIYPFTLKIVTEDELVIKIHEDALCLSIKPSKINESENHSILLKLLAEITHELDERNLSLN